MNNPTYSVSELNRQARSLLEQHLAMVQVEGEISNLSRPGSGHWYFTLKDDRAQVRCAMFRNRNMLCLHRPESGDQVQVKALVSLYEGRGDYQLIVEQLQPAGAGNLQRQFELLKARLAAEGLFDSDRKRSLPAYPARVVLITSATGAAVQDMLQVLARRCPMLPVTILPVPVQGTESAPRIIEQIRRANREALGDVLVLTRGGGSLEDLWSFNDEALARVIAASTIPVVSAVGHEIDFTIADFVADLRAPTPSAAAELISPDQAELTRRLLNARKGLQRALSARLRDQGRRLDLLRARLTHPRQRIQARTQQVDLLAMRGQQGMERRLQRLRRRLDSATQRLTRQDPAQRIRQGARALENCAIRLHNGWSRQFEMQRSRWQLASERLHLISPLATLDRGFAVVTDGGGRVLRSAASVQPGARVDARLAQGRLRCQVLEVDQADRSAAGLP